MSENFNKKCNAGSIVLASPYFEYVYSLPLVSFGDAKGSVELGIVYNSQLASSNLFNIANGFKLNLQKKLIFNNGKVSHIIDSNGLQIACNEATNGANNYGQRAYALNDESQSSLSNVSVNAMNHLDAIDDAFYFSDLGYLNSIAGKIWFL